VNGLSSGLPASVPVSSSRAIATSITLPASVTVKLPDGSSRAITASTTLPNVQPGAYTVAANDVTGIYTFKPQPLEQGVTVAAGGTAKATVNYQATTGALEYRISGMLAGQKPSIILQIMSKLFGIDGDKFLSDLEPGDYVTSFHGISPVPGPVDTVAGFRYDFELPTKITISPGETAQVNTAFVAITGSLDLSIVGLPSGANARISVEGVTVPKSSIVNYLRIDKSSDITAEDVAFDDFNYKPESRLSAVTAKRGEVIPVTFRYIPLDGKLQVAVSNPPPDPFKPLRVKGPAGFDGGAFNANTTFAHLESGAYTLTAQSVTVAPGKPGCKVYAPNAFAQSASVVAGQSVTVSVAYTVEPCK
jgi:hypothetical protein